MAGNLQIQGGGYQDNGGNPLANGYLTFQLSHDAQYQTGGVQIVGGIAQRVQLDGNGNVPTSPAAFVYSNDVLAPAGTYYIVNAYKSDGTSAWRATQRWTLSSSPNPLSLGTVVPNLP